MPSRSKKQYRFMQTVKAYKSGKTKDVSKEIKKASDSMSTKQIDDYLKSDYSKLEENIINEFQEDLGKRCIVLSGLPASGKSTFIKTEINKYIQGFSNYKVSNSDAQVKALQYTTARNHFDNLIKQTNKTNDINKVIFNFKSKSIYKNNRGNMIEHPITVEWWEENKDKGLDIFWKTFYKHYYATYFDIRDLAKEIDKQLFNTKIVKAGDILVIDTVGAKPDALMPRLEKLKNNNYTNIIIYLEISPNFV